MNESSNVFQNLRVPEMWPSDDAPEIIPYCIDVATFALRKIDDWRFPVSEFDAPDFTESEATLVSCWKQATATLKELGGMAECLDGIDDAPSEKALVTATDTTLKMLHIFCDFAFTLNSAVTKECRIHPDSEDLNNWSVASAKDVAGLLAITLKLLEIRSNLPVQSEDVTAEEPAAA
ncbi:hypothetical protein LCGC14_2124570 [marine sediment metagenome]|uniref:Uncharacterized protein n=1 Tax=marine sediment metagenome TaxID=412755 RepID=A0A0F9EQE0_9ZZZZ